jgi:hypothetical protein
MGNVYDPETKTVKLMPACEPATGMLRFQNMDQP